MGHSWDRVFRFISLDHVEIMLRSICWIVSFLLLIYRWYMVSGSLCIYFFCGHFCHELSVIKVFEIKFYRSALTPYTTTTYNSQSRRGVRFFSSSWVYCALFWVSILYLYWTMSVRSGTPRCLIARAWRIFQKMCNLVLSCNYSLKLIFDY